MLLGPGRATQMTSWRVRLSKYDKENKQKRQQLQHNISTAPLIHDLHWLRINERIQYKLASITLNLLMQLKLDNLPIYLNFCIFMFLRVLYDLNLI